MDEEGAQDDGEQAGNLAGGDGFAQEDDCQNGNLDDEGVVDDAGFDGGQGAQGVVPEGEGEGGVNNSQPEDDEPGAPA